MGKSGRRHKEELCRRKEQRRLKKLGLHLPKIYREEQEPEGEQQIKQKAG